VVQAAALDLSQVALEVMDIYLALEAQLAQLL
jgi:hypothetical protein